MSYLTGAGGKGSSFSVTPSGQASGPVRQATGAEFFEAPVHAVSNYMTEARESFTIQSDGNQVAQTLDFGASQYWLKYDADGNLVSEQINHGEPEEPDEPNIRYKFDAENRLVEVSKVAGPGQFKKIYTYDYMGRRIGERYYSSPSSQTPTHERRYIYNGMEIILETDGTGNVLKRFTWGFDISGTRGGAGGIGGLLLIEDVAAAKSYFPGYDGRGNLSLLVDSVSGAPDAVFEYSPYGRTFRASGPAVGVTPFRYQTKWWLDYGPQAGNHWEMDQYDYGLRIYDAQMGRFISRDPLGEAGGMNLYAAFGNDPVNRFDYLGLNDEGIDFSDEDEDDKNKDSISDEWEHWLNSQVTDLPAFPVSASPLGKPVDVNIVSSVMFENAPGISFTIAVPVTAYRQTALKPYVPQKKENKSGNKGKSHLVDEDLLKELCSTDEGRAMVDMIRNEGINIYTSETAFPSQPNKLGLGFFDQTTYSRTGEANIYVNRTLSTPRALARTGYSGTARQTQAMILRHELYEYENFNDMPNSPPWARDAHALVQTDNFAQAVGYPQWYPGRTLQDHLNRNRPTSSNPSGYGRTESANSYLQQIADRILLEGWDCSRVDGSKD